MSVLDLGNPISYENAGDILLDKINLNNVQVSDYNNFIRNILPRYMSIPIKTNRFSLSFTDWYLDDSDLIDENVCKRNSLSRETTLRATAELSFNKFSVGGEDKLSEGSLIRFPIEITKIPYLSEKGSFIIKGTNRVMVSHLERANTLLKTIDANGNKAVSLSVVGPYFKVELDAKGGMNVSMKAGTNENREIPRVNSNIGLKKLLVDLGIEDATEIEALLGRDPIMFDLKSKSTATPDPTGSNALRELQQIRLTTADRSLLNKKLSFRTRLTGRKLASDVEVAGRVFPKGTIVKPDEASFMQNNGLTHVPIIYTGGEINIWNNSFAFSDEVMQKNEIPDIFKIRDTESDDIDRVVSYHDINREVYKMVKAEVKEYNLDLEEHMRLNVESLLGTILTKEDVLAILNYFAFYVTGIEEVDDRDSLTNKSLINVSTAFETLLVQRLYGMRRTEGASSILTSIDKMLDALRIRTTEEHFTLTGLDCGDNTISNTLIKNPWSKLFQVESNINPLDEMNHKRKISLIEVKGRGGVNQDFSDPRPRSVNPSHMGRICPIESPEGATIGLIVHLATLARVNENGIIEAPFFKVDKENQRIDYSKAIYMDYNEEMLYTRAIVPKIAKETFAKVVLLNKGTEVKSYDLMPVYGSVDGKNVLINKRELEDEAKMLFDKCDEADTYKLTYGRKDWFIDDPIDCMEGNGHPVKSHWEDIDYVTCRGEHILSAVTGNIAFAKYNDGTRLMMGASMNKQTEAVIGSEPALIKTPLTDKIGLETSGVIVAPYDCEVIKADAVSVEIRNIEKPEETQKIPLEKAIVTSEKTILSNYLRCRKGDVLLKGDVIADTDATKDGVLQIGTNLLVGYMTYHGYNYEDAILLSSRMIEEDILTSYRATQYEFTISDKKDKLFLDERTNEFSSFVGRSTPDGIIKVGSKVNKDNSTLAIKFTAKQTGSGEKYICKTLEYDGEVEGTVVRVDKIEESGKRDKEKINKYVIVVETKEKIAIGDKLAGRHGNKGVIAKIIPQYAMPFLEDGTPLDILLTPLGIPSRMNPGQLIETELGLILKELGFQASYDARTGIDIPKMKRITNEWVGDSTGKLQLIDGTTGKPYMHKTTVGYTVIHKLKHIASQKIYARGEGKPSQYTQSGQPTKGKKSGGGQRFGEMENWATTAHGVSNVLRELQQFKSDDPEGRIAFKKYKRSGTPLPSTSNIPMAYKTIVADLTAIGIEMRHITADGRELDVFHDQMQNGKEVGQREISYNENTIIQQEEEMRKLRDAKLMQDEKEYKERVNWFNTISLFGDDEPSDMITEDDLFGNAIVEEFTENENVDNAENKFGTEFEEIIKVDTDIITDEMLETLLETSIRNFEEESNTNEDATNEDIDEELVRFGESLEDDIETHEEDDREDEDGDEYEGY